jgi:hypothetical protein
MHFPWKFSLIFKTALIELYSVGENSVSQNSVGPNSCRSKFLSVKILVGKNSVGPNSCRSKFLSVKILVGQNSVGQNSAVQMYQNLRFLHVSYSPVLLYYIREGVTRKAIDLFSFLISSYLDEIFRIFKI